MKEFVVVEARDDKEAVLCLLDVVRIRSMTEEYDAAADARAQRENMLVKCLRNEVEYYRNGHGLALFCLFMTWVLWIVWFVIHVRTH